MGGRSSSGSGSGKSRQASMLGFMQRIPRCLASTGGSGGRGRREKVATDLVETMVEAIVSS